LSASVHGDSIIVSVVSDRLDDFHGKAIIQVRDTEKGIYFSDSLQLAIDYDHPEIIATYDKMDLIPDIAAEEAILKMTLLEKGVVIHQNSHLFVKAKSLKLIEPNIQIETTIQDTLIQVHLKSDAFAKSVELSTLDLEGTFSDNFFNLFPDEPVQVQFLPKNSVENKLPYFQIRSLYDVLDK
jgi:beta-mannosidase